MSNSVSRRRRDRTVQTFLMDWSELVVLSMDEPCAALTLFIIGAAFINVASSQVHFCIALLESFGMTNAGNVIGYLMSFFVFFFVWIDLILLSHLKAWAMPALRLGSWWLTKLVVVLKRMYE